MTEYKKCRKCGLYKSRKLFGEERRVKDGLTARCTRCLMEDKAEKARDRYQANREELLRRNREWKERNAEQQTDYRRRAYAADPEKFRARAKAAREARTPEENAELDRAAWERNKDRGRANRAEYRKNNRHKFWESGYFRRAIKYGHDPVIKTFTLEDLVARYGDECVDCGDDWTDVDHIIPVRFGGEHSLDNCEPVCRSCNFARWKPYAKEAYAVLDSIYSGDKAA